MYARTGTLSATFLAACIVMLSCGKDSNPITSTAGEGYPFDQFGFPMERTSWRQASAPAQLTDEYVRGEILWHEERDAIALEDVFQGDPRFGEPAPGSGAFRPFRMIFRPRDTAYYLSFDPNGGAATIDSITIDHPSWAGITAYIGALIKPATEYFELAARATGGKVHIEFGTISEDIDGDGMLDEEGFNGFLTEREDLGLDGLPDGLEISIDGTPYYPVTNPDPAGDNWWFNEDEPNDSLYYEFLNGTEGNIHDLQQPGVADREQLSNRGFNTVDSYFSFVVDFANNLDSLIINTTEYGWSTYRIPIKDCFAIDTVVVQSGSRPGWQQVTHARIWFEAEPGQSRPDTLEIGAWYFAQSEKDTIPVSEQTVYTRDWEYAEGRLFDLFLPEELELHPGDSIVRLSVYELQTNMTKPGLLSANMYASWDDTTLYMAEKKTDINVLEVSPEMYEFFSFPSVRQHYIHFMIPKRNYALAVYMEVAQAGGGGIRGVGDVSGSPLKLKMIRDNLSDATPSQKTWQLMWRNCYGIPRDVPVEDLKAKVFKGLPGSEGTSTVFEYQQSVNGAQNYIEILGLDQYNNVSGQVGPDGTIDNRQEVFRPDWGLLIFPHRRPFDTDTTYGAPGNETDTLNDRVPELYHYTSVQEKQQASRYFISFSVWR